MTDQSSYPGASVHPYPHVVLPCEPAYFVRREPPERPNFEAAYWGTVTDPDGRVRDRRLERDLAVSDLKAEISAVEKWAANGERVLDVGCGLGFLLSALSPRLERFGVEVSSFACSFANREFGLPVFNGTLADALSLGLFKPASFDVVVCHHVVEHVDRPLDLMASIEEVVRPGGLLVLGTPDFDGTMARRYGDRYRMLHDPTHVSLFTQESVYRMLRDRGWTVERVDFPYFETRHWKYLEEGEIDLGAGLSPAFPGSFMTFYCRR